MLKSFNRTKSFEAVLSVNFQNLPKFHRKNVPKFEIGTKFDMLRDFKLISESGGVKGEINQSATVTVKNSS